MSKDKKKKGHKTMRKPPSDPDLDSWVSGADSTEPKNESTASDPPDSSNLGSQVTDDSTDESPSGTGIVERADGTYRRRMVVYLDTEHAKALKVHAALNDRNMSEIVDELIGDWIASKNS